MIAEFRTGGIFWLSWRYFENTIFQAGGMFGTGNILLTGSTLRAGVITLLGYIPIWWYVYQCSRVCYIPYRALCTYHEHCSELTTFFRSDSILEQRLRQIAVSRFNLFAFIISVLFHFVPNDFVFFLLSKCILHTSCITTFDFGLVRTSIELSQ